jgi:hypothetical protein
VASGAEILTVGHSNHEERPSHLGAELGGRREPAADSPNDAWKEGPFRGYADHMASEGFAAGIARLERRSRGTT